MTVGDSERLKRAERTAAVRLAVRVCFAINGRAASIEVSGARIAVRWLEWNDLTNDVARGSHPGASESGCYATLC